MPFFMKFLNELFRSKEDMEASFYNKITNEGLGKAEVPRSIVKDKEKFIKAINCHKYFFQDYFNHHPIKRRKIKKRIIKDYDIMLNASAQLVFNFQLASIELKSNRKFVTEAIKLEGSIFRFLMEEFKNDETLAMEAAKNWEGFAFDDQRYYNNKEIAAIAIKTNSRQLPLFSKAVICSNLDGYLPLIKENLFLARNISWIHYNKEMILEIAKDTPEVIQFASKNLQEDLEFNLQLIKENPNVFFHLTKELQENRLIQSKAVQSGINPELIHPFLSKISNVNDENTAKSAEFLVQGKESFNFGHFFKKLNKDEKEVDLSRNQRNSFN